ncbi:DExH-box ATP-dependent RNA helicase DExH3-like protein [Drosera capensis]
MHRKLVGSLLWLVSRNSISSLPHLRCDIGSGFLPSYPHKHPAASSSRSLSYGSSIFLQHRRAFCGFLAEQFSDDEYECDYETQSASSPVANIDEWKWKVSMLQRNEAEQEIVSRDKRDRRDFEEISNLAKRMGLYCEMYGKVMVASNYRPDLDDKPPRREVVIPLGLPRRVEGLLQEHIDRMQLRSGKQSKPMPEGRIVTPEDHADPDDNPDFFVRQLCYGKGPSKEELATAQYAKSLAGMESPEGRRMLEFRKSLPAFKEKERLLQGIVKNQVVVISGETGCGKTTQLPQYILESEIESGRGAFSSIMCTQPRIISAMAVAERVSTERGEPLGETGFAYPVRAHFLEDVLEMTGYKLTSFNQVDDCGQEKVWKAQKQSMPRKKKNRITSLVESRGRAGRVQPGECYHLFPRRVYEAFADYQLSELLKTPLNSLCLQIKNLLTSIVEKQKK